jgi:hypothetical protein
MPSSEPAMVDQKKQLFLGRISSHTELQRVLQRNSLYEFINGCGISGWSCSNWVAGMCAYLCHYLTKTSAKFSQLLCRSKPLLTLIICLDTSIAISLRNQQRNSIDTSLRSWVGKVMQDCWQRGRDCANISAMLLPLERWKSKLRWNCALGKGCESCVGMTSVTAGTGFIWGRYQSSTVVWIRAQDQKQR